MVCRAASGSKKPDPEARAALAKFFKHSLWSVNEELNPKLRALPDGVLAMYRMATNKMDATMLVIEGDWNKQSVSGPTSLVGRCLGMSVAHIDFIKDPKSPDKPLHFQPLDKKGSCSTYKLFTSPACQDKHKTLFKEIVWLSELQPKPVYLRHKFEMVGGDDASALLNRLKSCPTLAGTRNYRWLITKEEHKTATLAVVSALSIAPKSVKIVMTLSSFLSTLEL